MFKRAPPLPTCLPLPSTFPKNHTRYLPLPLSAILPHSTPALPPIKNLPSCLPSSSHCHPQPINTVKELSTSPATNPLTLTPLPHLNVQPTSGATLPPPTDNAGTVQEPSPPTIIPTCARTLKELVCKQNPEFPARCNPPVTQPPPKQTMSHPQYASLWDAEEAPAGGPTFRNSLELDTTLQNKIVLPKNHPPKFFKHVPPPSNDPPPCKQPPPAPTNPQPTTTSGILTPTQKALLFADNLCLYHGTHATTGSKPHADTTHHCFQSCILTTKMGHVRLARQHYLLAR